MTYVKDNSYRDLPFSQEVRRHDFYTFSTVRDLAQKCEKCREKMIKCRTVGVLQSSCGRFYLTDIDLPLNSEAPAICISLVYLKIQLKSTVVPYTVQVFGTLQWKNQPVLFVKILEILDTKMAIRIKDAMSSIVQLHLASNLQDIADNNGGNNNNGLET